MIAFADTSVFLRRIFSEPRPLAEWFQIESGFISRIAIVEIARAIDRFRSLGKYDDTAVAALHVDARRHLETFTVIPISEDVLELAARPMPTSLGTLDAIHLASAMLAQQELGKKLAFATHDDRLGLAARATGFNVIGG